MTRATDIEQQACEWLIRSEGADFTDGQRAELQRWLRNPRHRGTFVRIRAAWDRAGRVRGVRPLDGPVDPDLLNDAHLTTLERQDAGRPAWRLRRAPALGLTLLLGLLGLAGWVTLSPSSWKKYTTGVGGYKNIPLPDGSAIQLNTDSEVQTRLTAQAREIQLVRGEARFEFVNDPHRPVTIKAANVAVRVNQLPADPVTLVVRLRTQDTIDASVTHGSVALEPAWRLFDIGFEHSSVPASTIAEGQQAAIGPQGVRLRRVGLEEFTRKISWTTGVLSFRGETLFEVADEFNRYNRKHLLVTDPAIANRRVGGTFQATDLASFVSALRKSLGVQAYESPENSAAGVIRLVAAK